MEVMQVAFSIQLRRDTSANWGGVNPVLLEGELGFETDTGKLKIGDGSTAWNTLDYFGGEEGTSTNTPNTVVQRDGSGNFAAGTITANLNGSYTNVRIGSASSKGKIFVQETTPTGAAAGDIWLW
jgi:hypothetical protein